MTTASWESYVFTMETKTPTSLILRHRQSKSHSARVDWKHITRLHIANDWRVGQRRYMYTLIHVRQKEPPAWQ